jgi:hypothetical protein
VKNGSGFLAAVLLMAVVAPFSAQAQNLTIDNFSTAPYKKQLMSGSDQHTQAGTMLGGSRYTDFVVCEPTPCHTAFNQPGSFQIRPDRRGTSALIHSAGYKVYPRLVVEYGAANPLQLNLSGSYDRLRVNFDGSDQVVNFNIVVFSPSGYYQSGCNLDLGTNPVSVDFPLADFSNSGGDFTNVSTIAYVMQTGSAVGANDWAITSFEAVPAGAPPAQIICHGLGT